MDGLFQRINKVAVATLLSFTLAHCKKATPFCGRLLGQGRNFFEIPAQTTAHVAGLRSIIGGSVAEAAPSGGKRRGEGGWRNEQCQRKRGNATIEPDGEGPSDASQGFLIASFSSCMRHA